MACLYYVNGDWVTENQFKELLNNGLLDNLIRDNKLNLKGFKLDSSKLIETKTEEVTTSTVSATKLASILAEEVKGRAGYPINMLSALELNIIRNPDGTINEELTDFKIPLWASPYASKFESLLTSLVSNKVIKQKLPGNSYVLGSEEGFRIKEGDETAGELKNSNIVFTEKFDPKKGLQPLRWDPEAKKMLPAQIMIPFKFRDESGKILDLKQFTIKGPDGRIMLDMDKVPEKLLKLFGFRIPTQKQNSMAAVEIVGFLPETSGDLMLAPRDFTKQMGSDFDVDKLYTYMYNHYFLDGKLHTNFVSDPKKIDKLLEIAKQQLENLKEEYKLSKAERKLIDKYIKEKVEADEKGEPVSSELAQKVSALIEESMTVERGKGYPILEEFKERIDNAVNAISVLNRSYKAARQNNILDIHLKVMLSSNPEVIAAVLALDSSGEFKKLSEDIYRVRVERGLVDPVVSILSETYQRTKFINATAGKNGVGYFSLDSTFNASAQGKELVYDNLTDEVRDELYQDGRPTAQQVLENNMPVATFGESVSKGDLSNKYTLRSQLIIDKAKAEGRELTREEKASLKLKSLVIRSLQSASVDNEKEQILDKLNISDETIHAIRALTLLGFEEDEISSLLTQEIIWEFVENIKEAGSSLSPYNANAKEDVFRALVTKYDPEGKFDKLSPTDLTLLQSQSAEKLLDNIFSDTKKLVTPSSEVTPDYNLEQLALLAKFMRLTDIGLQLNAVQSAINSESKGVPTSLIETRAKVEQINNLSSSPVFNAMNLIGKTAIEDGLRVVTPNSINGFAAMYGTFFANDIFKKYFPYDSQGFKTVIAEITAHMPARASMSVSAATQLKKDVFAEIKSYLFANSNTNLFNGNPDLARRILFVDSKENTSLARKLSMLQSQTWFQRNGFLNKLDFDLNKNGQPSRVNFEAATGENFDERNIYDGFIYLIDKNFVVGTFKVDGVDVEYTSRMLAQELVTAAYLEGGMQGAKQYLKYIPNAYLKTIGFGEYLQGVEFDFQFDFFGTMSEAGLEFTYSMPSRFTRQFFQNNPDKSKTISLTMMEGNPTKIPDSFVLKKDFLESNFVQVTDHISGEPTLDQTKFVSVYDTKLPGKYALYEFDSVARVYKRIPTLLGSYGFVQYNSEKGNVIPLEAINATTTPSPEIGTPGYEIKNIPVKPSQQFTPGVVNNTAPVVDSSKLAISENLSGTKEALDDLLNTLADSSSISTLHSHLIETLRTLELPADFKVVYDNNISGRGSFDSSNNTLTINLKHPRNQEIDSLANVVTHELIHAHTSKSIQQYFRKTYSGRVTSLQPNQIFVFGSNPEGRHGAGAAKYAKDNFGAVYGQGEGLQGQSYALPTKDLRVKTNNSLRSISAEDITENIKKLYEVAKQNPTKEFLVSDYSESNLNGYTGQEMAAMFNAAGPIPTNIVFNENFNKLVTGLTEGQIQSIQNLENLQNKYIETLVAQEGAERLNQFTQLYSNWKKAQANFGVNSTEASAEYKKLQAFLKAGDLSKYYGAIKLTEFVTMALTDEGFQERLNNIKDADGVSMWTKIKEAILDILNALGLDIQPGSALAYAIKESMDLIKANQEELKKNLVETKEFIEFGTKYRFEVNSEGIVTKAEYSQGNHTVFNPMNKTNAQKTYDRLSKSSATQVTAPSKAAITQPSTSAKPTIDTSREWKGDLESRPVYTPEGVNTMRTSAANSNEHFGNPFSEAGYGNTRKVPTIQTAVQAYKDWLLTGYATWLDENGEAEDFAGNQEQRKWILDQINQGKLDGAKLLYAGKSAARGQGMHPTALAEVVEILRGTQPTVGPEAGTFTPKYEIFPGVFANEGQTKALDKMTDFLGGQDKTFLLKGRGGTGKTTIVKMVMDKSNITHNKILGATVSDEARGILEANLPRTIKTKTIASALGLVPDFNSKTGELYFRERNLQEQKDFEAKGKRDAIESADLIIIDEASMVGEDIYEILMRKKRPNAKVIFMGDNAQIPPIMPDGSSKDSPVFELLEGTENFSELTQRMRQGEESPILPVTDVYAENIEDMQRGEQGKENPLTRRTSSFDPNTNSGVIFTDNRQDIVDGFVADFQNDPDNLKNAVIIGARNEVVDNFSQLVRNKLFDNPAEPFVIGDIIRVNSPFVQGKEVLYANGFKGKVIAVESLGIDPLLNLEKFSLTVEYDSVDNAGTTTRKTTRMTTISPEDKKSLKSMLQALAVKAKSKQITWQTYYAIKESIVDLGYNYAMTSHKVQGSTYKNVYVLEDDIMSFPGGRLQRNRMLYTAVSRPTTKLVLFSSKNAPTTTTPFSTSAFSEAGINLAEYSEPSATAFAEEEGTYYSEEKGGTEWYDDYEAYKRAREEDDNMLDDSPINKSALENYLLICGK